VIQSLCLLQYPPTMRGFILVQFPIFIKFNLVEARDFLAHLGPREDGRAKTREHLGIVYSSGHVSKKYSHDGAVIPKKRLNFKFYAKKRNKTK